MSRRSRSARSSSERGGADCGPGWNPSNFPSEGHALDTRCHHLNFVVPKYVGTLHQHADVVAAIALQPTVRAAFFKQDFKPRSAESFDEAPSLVLAKRTQHPGSALYLHRRHFPGQLGGRGSSPHGVWEDVKVGKWKCFDKSKVLIEVLSRLAGKPGDEVGADCCR